MEEKVNKAAQLLEYWEEYLSISETTTHTMEEEVQLFIRRIGKLEGLLKELYLKCNSTDEGNTILHLLDKCSKIFEVVSNDKSLSAGGRFEWVNSVLVKCLQEGSWLLVDNVNLCSAAVLDRLNALLEPNGVLTISERGVDDNGKMFEVKPHKDFRIFLTMDPKNGEISRAMRNRGVEIYMLNETEETSTNEFDLKSLIALQGLTNPNHINALLKVHEFISSLILSEQPGNQDILQCSSLISQQISHGIDVSEAFHNTCIEVYYKTRNSSEFNCNNVAEVIKDGIERCITHSDGGCEFYNENVTLATKDLVRWSNLEKVKHQSAIFRSAVARFSKNVQEAKTPLLLPKIVTKSRNAKDLTIWADLENVKHQNDFFNSINFYTLANLLVINFTLSSCDDVDIRTMYLQNIINKQEWQDALERFKKVTKFFDNKHLNLPFDSRWINDTNNADNITSNAINYALQVEVHKLKDIFEMKYSNKHSLYQYLLALKKKRVSDMFNNSPICINYINMRSEHYVFMRQLFMYFAKYAEVEKTFVKVLELLSWRQALHSFLTSVRLPEGGLKNPASFESKLDTLALYYKWFYKYSVEALGELLGAKVPQPLENMLSEINETIEDQFSSNYKIASNYKKINNVPEFFTSEWQLTALDLLQTYDMFDSRNDPKKIIAFHKSIPESRNLLTNLKYQLYNHNSDNNELLLSLVKPFKENIDGALMKQQELEIVPIVNVLTQMILLRIIEAIESGNSFQLDSLNNNIIVPIEFNGVLLRYKETNDKKLLHEIKKEFYTTAANSPDKFIAGENAGISSSIAGIGPALLNTITQLIVRLDGERTTLNNFRDVENQRRFLMLAFWDNIYAISDKSFDFLSIQFHILEGNVHSFIRRLQQSLKLHQHDLEHFSCQDPTLNAIVSRIISKYKRLKLDFEDLKRQDVVLSYISDVHMNISFAEMYLNSLLPRVDPLAKKAMKKNHIASVMNMFEQMKRSFELQNRLFSNEDCQHPYVKAIQEIIEDLRGKIKKYGESANVGVKSYPYSFVIQEIKYAYNTLIDTTILDDIATCTDLITNLKIDKDTDIIKDKILHYESKIPSFERILQDWKLYRGSYPDIVEPLLANIAQFLYGFKLKLFWIKRQLVKCEFETKYNLDLEMELVALAALPSLSGNVSRLGTLNLFADENKETRSLKCYIQECFNKCVINAKNFEEINDDLLEKFNDAVEQFVNLWDKQQEKKEHEKIEAESLYKTRTKCDDKTEDQQAEEELKELFPNHHVLDFSDLHHAKSLSDSSPETPQVAEAMETITDEDLRFVVDLHAKLFKNFIRTEWLAPAPNKNVRPDFVSPLMEKYKVVRRIMDNHAHYFQYTLDAKLAGSLAVLLEVSRRYGAANELIEVSSPRINSRKSKDFYRDRDIEEVKSCYHVLQGLKLKVNELLLEWPDQPTLNTILTVIERILNFDITSPIARYLTGFDILLSKCYEWEQVAHSGVSLINNTPELVAQIIAWRKLELGRWKELLNSTFVEMTKGLTKWWHYMYKLSREYVEENNQISESELVDTLQKFITKSSLAEFQGRLDIVLEFHCYAITLTKTPQSASFINVLWNVYNYFNQFSSCVADKIKTIRTPIERKLKDYVKIVKWKDVSYWSVKDTVDKSYKTLHKFVKEFKEVLSQPVAPYLTNPPSDNPVESVGMWDRPQRRNPKAYHYTLDADSYIVKTSVKDSPYLSKARKICKETILATDYPNLVKSLDSFVGDVIETSSHLRKLEVDTTLPKEKQKSQAKTILQQKHRALSDLFQSLSKMGVSYKTGIIDSKLKQPSEVYALKPIDLSAGFSYFGLSSTDEKILTIWDSCELYFYRCLMRYDVLETALATPAQDLGMQNVERCRGFSAHLLTLCQNQKKLLIESTRWHYILRGYARQLHEACECATFIASSTLIDIKNLLNSLTSVITQIQLILNSCPEEMSFSDELMEVPLLDSNCHNLKRKDDERFKEATHYVNSVNALTLKILNAIQKTETSMPHTDIETVRVELIPFANKDQVFQDLQKISHTLNKLRNLFEPLNIVDSLSFLSKSLTDIIEQSSPSSLSSSEEYQKSLESLTKSLLIVFQNLYKKYRKHSNPTQPNAETDEDISIQDNHLAQLIMENLSMDMATLDLVKVFNMAGKILVAPNEMKTSTVQHLPLLDQLVQLSQYFITQQVAAYRTTCKLTSVLINIFIDLASKGFCVPPELSDETDKEGMSKPTDGMGLGEGEGQRDVSDKIESEDQLEDAQPAGQEKEDTEDPDCKEEDKGIEMSEDFDSKLQDKKPSGEDENDEQSDNSDAEEQMGETEKGADQLDQEIWGDDKDEEEDENNEDSEEQKEEDGKGGEKDGENQLGAKDDKKSKNKDPSEGQDEEDSEKNKKEINEMNEPEYDDEQTDPYHGNQPELPEPEPMDLPDNLQLDEGEEKDGEQPEENPFDIDEMKDQQVPEDKPEDASNQAEDEKNNDEEKEFSSDDEDITKHDDDKTEKSEQKNEEETVEEPGKSQEEGDEEIEEPAADNEENESALDQNPSNQENIEAMETDDANAIDKTQATQSENLKSEQPIEETCQEDKPDKDGVGQSQMEESESGHSVQSSAPQQAKSSNTDQEHEEKCKERPGESDLKRSLGDVDQPVEKKLKTMDAKDSDNEASLEKQKNDMYQHIKEAKDDKCAQVLDAATKEQAEEQRTHDQDEADEENVEADSAKEVPEDPESIDVDMADVQNEKPLKPENAPEKSKNKKQHPEGDIMDEINDNIEIDGDIVKTSTVPRGADSFHHTQYHLLQKDAPSKLTQEEINAVRNQVEQELSQWKSTPSSAEAEQTWQKISSVTSNLAQDLSEQLRLVLEPSQASHLKGDFRTGRRINMRKVIPYIASQFRKDKIWLRRTKPSKREYQIVLAIDDSSSMADNHSKEMAFESVALISKALSLLESGQLSVVSFGENTEVHHKLTEPFTDRSGVQLLQNFQFDQQKTNVGKLVDFVTEMFDQSNVHASIPNAKLLLIVSDGQGVFSEGKTYVTQAVRRAKLANVFIVFVIIDNPENKNSILDIKTTNFKDGKFLGIQNYMDEFPFSFYLILRDINTLPSVLSDALMQWFEMVTSQQ